MDMTVSSEVTGSEAPETQVETSERPSWLPEGFDSPEAFAAEYAKLKSAVPPAENTDPQDEPEVKEDASVSQFVAGTGLDPVALSQEIATNGDINADAKAKIAAALQKANLPAKMIDEYISGQKYAAQAIVNDLMSVTGGQEGFKEMAAWAGKTLSQDDLNTFNEIMQKGDPKVAKLTLQNMYARYKQENPSTGKRVRGGSVKPSGDVFMSMEQMIKAQQDPNYAKDPAVREAVEAKIQRSLAAGTLNVVRTR